MSSPLVHTAPLFTGIQEIIKQEEALANVPSHGSVISYFRSYFLPYDPYHLEKLNLQTMKPIVRNILVVLAGLVIGSFINMLFVNMGPSIIPLPEGADVSTMEGLQESMKLFRPANFLFPFLGHAAGTLAGAFIVARFVTSHPFKFAMGLGVCFLIGGIAAVSMFGGPWWFKAADLLLAYIPMAALGASLADSTRLKKDKQFTAAA